MDQPGKVANPARGERKNEHFPVPVRAREFGLARRVRSSRSASARSISILRLDLVLAHGIPPDFRGGVHFFIQIDFGSSNLDGMIVFFVGFHSGKGENV